MPTPPPHTNSSAIASNESPPAYTQLSTSPPPYHYIDYNQHRTLAPPHLPANSIVHLAPQMEAHIPLQYQHDYSPTIATFAPITCYIPGIPAIQLRQPVGPYMYLQYTQLHNMIIAGIDPATIYQGLAPTVWQALPGNSTWIYLYHSTALVLQIVQAQPLQYGEIP